MRDRHGLPAYAGIPTPEDQLVAADVLHQCLEILPAVRLLILEVAAKLSAREVDEHHLGLMRWQVPVRSPGRHVRSVARGRVLARVTRRAAQSDRAPPIGTALHVL